MSRKARRCSSKLRLSVSIGEGGLTEIYCTRKYGHAGKHSAEVDHLLTLEDFDTGEEDTVEEVQIHWAPLKEEIRKEEGEP